MSSDKLDSNVYIAKQETLNSQHNIKAEEQIRRINATFPSGLTINLK